MLKLKLSNGIKCLVVSMILSLLFACVNKPLVSSDSVVVDDLSLEKINNQNKAINTAITKLENGKNYEAKLIIRQVLNINQNHSTARLLERQLTLPAKSIFKTTRFTEYKVRSGDTLSRIASTWLGNSIYFVSLAILNKIDNPTKITPGLLLKIPVIKTSPMVVKEKRRSRANLNLLKRYKVKKQYIRSLRRMSSIYIDQSHHTELVELQKQLLDLLAVSRVSISERHKMVDQVEAISTTSKRKILANNFRQFIKQQRHIVLLDEFVLLFDDKSYYESAEKLIEAKKIKSIQKQSSQILKMEDSLIDRLHENAIILRKDQRLDQAVRTWKTIIQIQPNNKLAIKYYKRTNKLLERLKELN